MTSAGDQPIGPPPAYNGDSRHVPQTQLSSEGSQPLLSESTGSGHRASLDSAEDDDKDGDPALALEEERAANGSRLSIAMEELRRDDPLEDDEETGLTEAAREARRSRLARRTDLDNRVAEETEVDIEEEAARFEGNQNFIKKITINGILIALWYLFSICISVYNKWMFSPTNLDFHFPMFVTSVHMIVQFILSALVLLAFPKFRPKPDFDDDPDKPNEAPKSLVKKPLMTPWFYLTRITSCGFVTGLDIGLGNTSLKFITLSFFTMCKSSTLGFVLFFAILFKLEKPSWTIGGIILVMTVGVVMMVAGETAFNVVGFILLMLASVCSGVRWSLTQILLRRTPATSNPFSTLFFLTPMMFLSLFLLAVPLEGFPSLIEGIHILQENKGPTMGIFLMIFPGVLAFLMTSAEFTLLKRTSVVTLSVCGIFKEVLTISAAGIIFGDELTPINISGLCITIVAIAAYNWIRMKKMKRKQVEKALQRVEEADPRRSTALEGEEAPGLGDPIVKSNVMRRGTATSKGDYSAVPNGATSGVEDEVH